MPTNNATWKPNENGVRAELRNQVKLVFERGELRRSHERGDDLVRVAIERDDAGAMTGRMGGGHHVADQRLVPDMDAVEHAEGDRGIAEMTGIAGCVADDAAHSETPGTNTVSARSRPSERLYTQKAPPCEDRTALRCVLRGMRSRGARGHCQRFRHPPR